MIAFDDDLPGFGIRMRVGGKRTWVVQYRVGRKQRRLTLGPVYAIDLDEARQKAKESLAKVTLADDPQAEKERKRAEAAITLGSVLDRYLAGKKDRLRPRSYVETERHLRRDRAPLHGQPITKIDLSALANPLGIIAKDNGPVAADRARAAPPPSSRGIARGDGVNNPVIGTNRPASPELVTGFSPTTSWPRFGTPAAMTTMVASSGF